MNKNTFSLLIVLFIFQIVQTQTIIPCGTVSTNILDYSSILANRSPQNQESICIDVQFHILRDSNGNGVVPLTTVNELFETMDNAFNSHNIFFNRLSANFINDSNYLNITLETFNNLIQTEHNPNAINIYCPVYHGS